jgi:hypothetical protein
MGCARPFVRLSVLLSRDLLLIELASSKFDEAMYFFAAFPAATMSCGRRLSGAPGATVIEAPSSTGITIVPVAESMSSKESLAYRCTGVCTR